MKPNKEMTKGIFNENIVTLQLKYSSTFEYRKLMQEGFPIQIKKSGILAYEYSEQTFPLENTSNLNLLLQVIGLKRNDFKLGRTKVFFRPLANLDMILNPSAELVLTFANAYKIKLRAASKWQKIARKVLENNLTSRNNESELKVETTEDMVEVTKQMHQENQTKTREGAQK